jgi:transposase
MARPLIENCDIDRWVRTCRRGHRQGPLKLTGRNTIVPTIWAGIDSGKRAHHCVVIDQAGTVLLSQRVDNDEAALLDLIGAVTDLGAADEVCWATDLNSGGAALLIALLAAHAQQLLYIPGRIVHHAAATYRGDGKTDAKDARIIADQARMRTDLQPVRGADQVAVDLRLLTSHRTDVVCDRVRQINRLRATLVEYFPALERHSTTPRAKPRSSSCPAMRRPGAFAVSASHVSPPG